MSVCTSDAVPEIEEGEIGKPTMGHHGIHVLPLLVVRDGILEGFGDLIRRIRYKDQDPFQVGAEFGLSVEQCRLTEYDRRLCHHFTYNCARIACMRVAPLPVDSVLRWMSGEPRHYDLFLPFSWVSMRQNFSRPKPVKGSASMPFNFDQVTFLAREMEEQFQKKDQMNEMEQNCHRQIVAGRLRAGYFEYQTRIGRSLMRKPVERGGQQTYLEYWAQVKETVRRPIFNPLTVIESQIIYLACGIRNSYLSAIVLRGYDRNELIFVDLKSIVHHQLWLFECSLSVSDLPLWSNLSRLELAYHPLFESGSTSDYESERD